ncbi:MAG: hypothetical protein IJ197_02245 [Bacteroidaceae bacterium]|nr:hypothetical protein [Bacteroidaceae bacterium]
MELEEKVKKLVVESDDFRENGKRLENPKVEEVLGNWLITKDESRNVLSFEVRVRLRRNLPDGNFSEPCRISGYAKEEGGTLISSSPNHVTNFF